MMEGYPAYLALKWIELRETVERLKSRQIMGDTEATKGMTIEEEITYWENQRIGAILDGQKLAQDLLGTCANDELDKLVGEGFEEGLHFGQINDSKLGRGYESQKSFKKSEGIIYSDRFNFSVRLDEDPYDINNN